jgi:GT2 family glycosyltransferase
MSKPFIEVVIPYEPCKNPGVAFNRVMEKAHDWVLLMDHDLFLCNPNWYEAFLDATMKLGHQAGWISAVTNRCASSAQKSEGCPAESDNLVDHIRWAEKVWEEHGAATVEGGGDNGLTILTHKAAWERAGGFPTDRGFHVDGDYYKAITKAGYKTYVMPGNYVYHLMDRKNDVWKWNKWKNFGVEWRVL